MWGGSSRGGGGGGGGVGAGGLGKLLVKPGPLGWVGVLLFGFCLEVVVLV